jgi:hypothetical protein
MSIKREDSFPKILLGVFPFGLTRAPVEGLFFIVSALPGLAKFALGLGEVGSCNGISFLPRGMAADPFRSLIIPKPLMFLPGVS